MSLHGRASAPESAFSCDLHCHSVYSDGKDTYAQLMRLAEAVGVELFVVSDHDVTPKAEEGGVPFEKLAFSEHALMVPGIEISCETQVSDVHIVGVGCDFSAPQFAKLQQDMQASKMAGYRILVDRLKEDGLDISWQKVLHPPDGAPITESALQRKHIFEAVARRGGAATWADAKVMVQTSPR
ncbi:MAG: PHP domain-containing protein, partial [Christensenellales bacterium]